MSVLSNSIYSIICNNASSYQCNSSTKSHWSTQDRHQYSRLSHRPGGDLKLRYLVLPLTFMLCSLASLPQDVSASVSAFPGAVGFGASATGGRGGKVYAVTNTKSSGTGSLSWALSQPGPRIIIFKTGGVINFSSDIPGNTTMFAQTAPGDGVAIKGQNIHITGDNVIIRGLRIFTGAGRNGLLLPNRQNIIIDHSSIAWVGNEAFSTWQNNNAPKAENITLSNTAIYAGLSKGPGHQVCLAGDSPKRWEAHTAQITPARKITLYRNAFINTDGRAPKFAGPVWKAEVVNNISMQAGTAGTKIDPTNSGNPNEVGVVLIHYIGNKLKNYSYINVIDGGKGYVSGSKVYIKDNINVKYSKPLSDTLKQSSTPVFSSLIPNSAIVSQNEAEQIVLNKVGPIPRDKYLAKAIDDYKNNRRHFQCPKDLPNLQFAAGKYPSDMDNDGLPDSWESDKGLDPGNANDASRISSSGYMWIEEYANTIIDGLNNVPPAPEPVQQPEPEPLPEPKPDPEPFPGDCPVNPDPDQTVFNACYNMFGYTKPFTSEEKHDIKACQAACESTSSAPEPDDDSDGNDEGISGNCPVNLAPGQTVFNACYNMLGYTKPFSSAEKRDIKACRTACESTSPAPEPEDDSDSSDGSTSGNCPVNPAPGQTVFNACYNMLGYTKPFSSSEKRDIKACRASCEK